MKLKAEIHLMGDVWVQLTDAGKAQAEQYYKTSQGYFRDEPIQLEKEWTKFKLHELMHIFGPVMIPGTEIVFKKNMVSLTDPST